MNENLSCAVIRDLLPLYAEGLCSEESRVLTESHLETCAECRKLYAHLPEEPEKIAVPEEGKALRKLNSKLRQNRFTKMMAAVFCVLLVLFGVWNGVWYVREYRPYYALCESWQGSSQGKGKQYVRQDENFDYTVKMPSYLSFGSGFIRVQPKEYHPVMTDENGNPEYVLCMFIWMTENGTEYVVDIRKGGAGNQFYMEGLQIDRVLRYIPYENQTAEEIARARQMIDDHREEILALMDAAQKLWGDKLA